MILLVLCVFIVNFAHLHSLNIDIASIHVVPELYQLCWKQNAPEKLDFLIGTDSGAKQSKFQVFPDRARSNYYCIVKRDISSYYVVNFPIKENGLTINLSVKLKFCLPLGQPLRFIRHQVVSNGVHFQLHHNFAGIISESSTVFCSVLISYSWKNSRIIASRHMDSSNDPKRYISIDTIRNAKRFISMDPGSTFKAYYSCNIPGWVLSSHFIISEGVVFSNEATEPLDPFIQFPFRRFLVSQWKHYKSYNRSYYTVISEVTESGKETCLKMFRLCSDSEVKYQDFLKIDVPSRCNKDIVLEDIGIYKERNNIRVVLDMVYPLKANTKHKFTILYQNRNTSKIEENFIYFETLANENSGYISNQIYSYQTMFDNKAVRNEISTMNQIVLSDFPDNPVKAELINISNFFEKEIIQSVSVIQYFKTNASGPLYYGDFLKECPRECGEGIYPYFYIILKQEKTTEKVEIIALPKNITAQPVYPQITPDSKTNTFTIYWNISNYPYAVTPSYFVLRMIKLEQHKTCSFVHFIVCKTCSQVHEFSLTETNLNYIKKCKDYKIWKNHYEANARFITFRTPQMVPQVNFYAEVTPFYLHTKGIDMLSSPAFIQESFWNKVGYFLTIAVGSVIGLLILVCIGVFIKFLMRSPHKQEESDENKYYTEDESGSL